MTVDLGSAASPYVLVYKERVALGGVISINTDTRSVKRFVKDSIVTEVVAYDDLVCLESAPDFVQMIPGMRTVKDFVCMTTVKVMPQFPVAAVRLDLEDCSGEETPSRPITEEYPALTEEMKRALTFEGTFTIQPMTHSTLTFNGRPGPEALDPHGRLCRFMWELMDKGDPEILERLRHHRIEFREADGTKVFPLD